MIGLTPRQRELLSYLTAYIGQHGFAPKLDEMKDALGFANKSRIFYLLSGLEERGYIRRLRNRARAIEVLHPAEPKGLRVVFGPGHFEDLARINRARWSAEEQRAAA